MRLLAAICLILSIGLYACSKGKPLPTHNVVYQETSTKDFIHPGDNMPAFSVYTSELNYRNKSFTGKLYAKRLHSGHYKLAYTTDSDFKLFALEITDTTINWEYLYPELDKKIIKKVLERDLRALTALVPQELAPMTSREERPHTIIGSPGQKVYIYWVDKNMDRPYKSLLVNEKEVLVVVHYVKEADQMPQRVKVMDHKVQLSLTLTQTKL